MYVTLRKAKQITGLCGGTLRKYADENKIPSIRNPAGQRLFDLSGFVNQKSATVIYARVSTHKQRKDLARQIEYLRQRYPLAEVVSDVGSGLNFKRKGLVSILERVLQGESVTVVVAWKDRLARFGFDLIEWLLKKRGGQVVVLNQVDYSPVEELTKDLLAIVTMFSARMHGLRSYRSQIKKDPALAGRPSEATAPSDDGNLSLGV